MSQKRIKIHKPGDRLSVYLNKDLPDHLFEWIAKQDDMSAFVIYALERLYSETGNRNVSDLLPRRFHFEDFKTTMPELIPKSPTNTASESIAIKYIEVPIETKAPVETIEIAENAISTVVPTQVERPIPESVPVKTENLETNTAPLVVHSKVSVEAVDKSSNTNQWANIENINPDDF